MRSSMFRLNLTSYQQVRGCRSRYFSTEASSSSSPLSSSSLSPLPSVTLYQYAICPYCNKTKAVMAYAGIKPTVIEVNPLTKAELPSKKEYRKVPIAIVDNQQVNGSDAIVDVLLQHPAVREHILAKSPSLKENWEDFTSPSSEDKDWVKFANKDLASLLYPNICATLGDSYKAFGYVNQVDAFSSLQKLSIRFAGSFAMYMAASRIKSKRGIKDEKAALQDALRTLQENGGIGGEHEFLSGRADPNLGDLAVYGTLRSVEGLPAHNALMRHPENVALQEWYLRVQKRMSST